LIGETYLSLFIALYNFETFNGLHVYFFQLDSKSLQLKKLQSTIAVYRFSAVFGGTVSIGAALRRFEG
jgi:hypothetical protein